MSSKSVRVITKALNRPQAGPSKRLFCTSIKRCDAPHAESSTQSEPPKPLHDAVDVDEILCKPTWSVSTTLLPSASNTAGEPDITPSKLHHLLRLSALPPPSSAEEESSMLRTLSNQLHFVRQIQRVDTSGVEPLRALRDETNAGELEREITIDSLRDAFEKEEEVGNFWRRPVRRKSETTQNAKEDSEEKWDPLENGSRTVGRYFVVDKGTKGSGD